MPAPKKIRSNFIISNLFAKEPDKAFVTLSPIRIDFALVLSLPAEKLQMNLLKMDIYEKAALDVCDRYGASLSEEVEKLVKIFQKMKKKDIVVDEKEASRQIEKTLKRFQAILKTLEKDVRKAVEDELKYQARKFEAMKDASIDVQMKWKPGDIKLELVKAQTQLPDMPGKEKILLAKKDLWKESGEDDSFENLRMPKLVAEVHYILDKIALQKLKVEKKLYDQLRKEMIDQLDKRIIPMLRSLVKAFKALDEAAKDGGIEYRIQYKLWKSKSEKLLTAFRQNLPDGLQQVWNQFTQKNKLFSGADMLVDLKIVLSDVKTIPGRVKRTGPLTPLGIAKSLEAFCKAFQTPKKFVSMVNGLEKKQEVLGKIITEQMDAFEDKMKQLGKGEEDKAFILDAATLTKWEQMTKKLKAALSKVTKVANDLEDMQKEILGDVQKIQKDLADRVQIKRYQGLEKVMEGIGGDFSEVQKSIEKFKAYEKRCDAALTSFKKKNTNWEPSKKDLKSIPILKTAGSAFDSAIAAKKEAFKIVDLKK